MTLPPDLRRQDGPHAFVEDLDAPHLSADDHHHLSRVLRLRAGDPMTVSDGHGRWRRASFAESPDPAGPVIEASTGLLPTTLAFALTKAGKPELVVQKATEIGIDHLVIFHGDHSVPRWDDAKRRKAQQRLERVAYEAAMQSRQVRIPTVEIVANLADVATDTAGPCARADFGGSAIGPALSTVIIGPEGGWSAAECERVPQTVDLGPSVLRAETAAVVAAAELVRARHLGLVG